jgi:hypothetical protein
MADTTDVFNSLAKAIIYAGGYRANCKFYIEDQEVEWDDAYDLIHYGTDTHAAEFLITGRRPVPDQEQPGIVVVQRKYWGQVALQIELAIAKAKLVMLNNQLKEMSS